MKSHNSREVDNETTGFLYLWRSDKIGRIGMIFDINILFGLLRRHYDNCSMVFVKLRWIL